MTNNYSEKWLNKSIIDYVNEIKVTNPTQFKKENLNEFTQGVGFSAGNNQGDMFVFNNKDDDIFIMAEIDNHGSIKEFDKTLPNEIKRLINEWASNRAQVKRNLANRYKQMKEGK